MDVKGLINDIACSKDAAAANHEALYAEFKKNAEEAGIHVHYAKDGDEANRIIADIAKKGNCKSIVKSKSMTAEETLLNHDLEDEGFEVIETDLGEWIIQLRHEGPSHMVMPAIHLSRHQVKDLFTDVTGKQQQSDIEKLVKVARRELRQKYVDADMGITGANFAVAETGGIGWSPTKATPVWYPRCPASTSHLWALISCCPRCTTHCAFSKSCRVTPLASRSLPT